MIAKERLYLTEKDKVVPAGDPRARWLFAAVGSEISAADVKRYGLDKKPAKKKASAKAGG